MGAQAKDIRVGLTTLQDGEGRWLYALVQFDQAAGVLARVDFSEDTFETAAEALTAGNPVLLRALGTA